VIQIFCILLPDLNSDVFKVEATDAKGADTIGIIAGIFVGIVCGLVVLLDLGPAGARLCCGPGR
jgi:hypothetical protein